MTVRAMPPPEIGSPAPRASGNGAKVFEHSDNTDPRSAPQSSEDGSREFSWHRDRDDIVVAEQQPIALYLNPRGDLVIRQPGIDEDDMIVVTLQNAPALARAILRAAGVDDEPAAAAVQPAPKDRTAAERMRRHRERQRNGQQPVTRNGHAPLLIEGNA
jgi:hypothetical protein